MALERYRLEALLRIKDKQKKITAIFLATCIKELEEAKEEEKRLIKERDKIKEDLNISRKKMSEGMGAGSLIFDGNVYTNYIRKLEEDIEEKENEIEMQKEVVKEKEEAVSSARRDYIEAAKELQVMEKHKDLWRKKIEKEISRKEERELNDLGNTIHQLKKWHGKSIESPGV